MDSCEFVFFELIWVFLQLERFVFFLFCLNKEGFYLLSTMPASGSNRTWSIRE